MQLLSCIIFGATTTSRCYRSKVIIEIVDENKLLVTVDWFELRRLAFIRLLGDSSSACFNRVLYFFLFWDIAVNVWIVRRVKLILGRFR